MKIDYSVLTAILAAAYLILKQVAPDFPITEQGLLLLVIWALAQLGVEVTAPAVRRFLIKRGLMKFEYEYDE
jgi:hypothetical protein